MAERCILLERATQVAASRGLEPDEVICPFIGSCSGSTNEYDCRMVQECFPNGPATNFIKIPLDSQPPNPVVPINRFYSRLEQAVGYKRNKGRVNHN